MKKKKHPPGVDSVWAEFEGMSLLYRPVEWVMDMKISGEEQSHTTTNNYSDGSFIEVHSNDNSVKGRIIEWSNLSTSHLMCNFVASSN